MKKLSLQTGKRPRSLNDLEILTQLAEKNGTAILKGYGAFICTGCEVSGGNTIAPGFVFIDGEIVEIDEPITGLTFPCYMSLGEYIDGEVLQYGSGDFKATQKTRTIDIDTSAPVSGEYITFTSPAGGKTYSKAIASSILAAFGSGSLGTSLLADGSVTNAKLAGSISDDKLAGSIPGSKLSNGAIAATQLATDAVETAKIKDANVTAAKLASNSVETAKVVDGAITNDKIASGTIGGSRISNGAIESNHINGAQIGSTELKSGAVTNAKLSTETLKKIGGDADEYSGSLALNSYTTTSSRVYSSYRLQAVLTDGTHKRHYIKFQIAAVKATGNTLTLAIERSTTGSFSGEQTVVKDITLEVDYLQQLVIDLIDTAFSTPNVMTYYQLKVTVATGNALLSSNAHALMFSVPYGF